LAQFERVGVRRVEAVARRRVVRWVDGILGGGWGGGEGGGRGTTKGR